MGREACSSEHTSVARCTHSSTVANAPTSNSKFMNLMAQMASDVDRGGGGDTIEVVNRQAESAVKFLVCQRTSKDKLPHRATANAR